MNYRTMFVVNAIMALLFGLGFLFVPTRVLSLFGTETFVSTVWIARLFGTAMLGLGLVLWFAKDVRDANLQKGMGIALLVCAIAGLAVAGLGTLTSHAVLRTYGWVVRLVYLIFGLGYGYLVFLKPESPVRPVQ